MKGYWICSVGSIVSFLAGLLFPPMVLPGFAFLIGMFVIIKKRFSEVKKADAETAERELAEIKEWRQRKKAEQAWEMVRLKRDMAIEKERKAERRRWKKLDRTPVTAELLSIEEDVNVLGKTLIGGLVLGPLGALIGAAGECNKPNKAVFSVKYASGRNSTETVEVGSRRYEMLAALSVEQ